MKIRKLTRKEVEKLAERIAREGVLLDWEDLVYARVPVARKSAGDTDGHA